MLESILLSLRLYCVREPSRSWQKLLNHNTIIEPGFIMGA